MSSLLDKVLNECGHEHERSAKNLARRLGVKRPAVFSVLFALRAASLVTSSTASTAHGDTRQKRWVKQRLMWRRVAAEDPQDPPATPPDADADAWEAV